MTHSPDFAYLPNVKEELSLTNMENKVQLSAIRVANQLDLKGIKSLFDHKPAADSSSELFYALGEEKFQYFFNYGVVAFCGYNTSEMDASIKAISSYLKNPDAMRFRDNLTVVVEKGTDLRFEFEQLVVHHLNEKTLRVIMLSLAQSVALDYYNFSSETLLNEIRGFANRLETTGKLRISRTNMMKFIGRALNTQNDIADNIYIFDAPEIVWDDEYLDKLQQGLMKQFDLRVRFSEIEYTLRTIESNLSVFREIIHQRESSLLEWIIIMLILVEVFDLLISKLL